MIQHHDNLIQGSDEWHAMRCGLITASQIKHLLSPTLKPANNDKTRALLFELVAQRITRYVEPAYISDDMLRGQDDEIRARDLYSERHAPVTECGFITNDDHGFTLGYSPDGLVGASGLIEVKSRRQRFQIETIISDMVPADYFFQVQAGLLIAGREWCDFVSYSGGMPMTVIRAHRDETTIAAIVGAAEEAETRMALMIDGYRSRVTGSTRHIPTERTVEQEMII